MHSRQSPSFKFKSTTAGVLMSLSLSHPVQAVLSGPLLVTRAEGEDTQILSQYPTRQSLGLFTLTSNQKTYCW
jgi:hypothetical protein